MDKKIVKVERLNLGDGKVYVQSMLNKPADDIEANIKQAKELEEAGCEIIRAAVPEKRNAALIYALKEALKIPVVADIHFDFKIALEAISAGADKIRINPGNIGGREKIKAVTDACRIKNIPIRVGVNSGSLEKDILSEYGSSAEALVKSAMKHIKILEELDFEDIVVSVKSSDVKKTIKAYRILYEQCKYPLHLGITEAGTERTGLIKSAIGIGSLLCDGIGDTIRVSLTAEPVKEIYAAYDILSAVGLTNTVEVISCPTCGRTRVDVIGLTEKVQKTVYGKKTEKPFKIAVMGCAVNGPGEAKDADFGIAGGNGEGLLFKKGEIIRKVKEDELFSTLMEELNNCKEWKGLEVK